MLLILFLIVRYRLKLRPRQPVEYKLHVPKDIENFKSDLRTQDHLHVDRQVRRILENEHGKNILETGIETDTYIIAEEIEGKALSVLFR